MENRAEPQIAIPAGLSEETSKVFEQVSKLDCIKDLYLCGGTAQSIQIDHRLSEDLDFELIGISKTRPQLGFHQIISELRESFPDPAIEILGDNHFEARISEGRVKLSFFRPDNPVKHIETGYTFNNIKTPSLQDLLGMKVFTTGVRLLFRDYYDIYCLLEQGCKLGPAIEYASFLSNHHDKSKAMYTRLLSPQLFPKDQDFDKMNPKYDVSPEQIAQRIKQAIREENLKPKGQAIE